MADIAKNDPDYYHRLEIIRFIKDQKHLIDFVKNDPTFDVSETVIKRIKDQSFLADISKNDMSMNLRRIAISLLDDPKCLVDISKSESDNNILNVAKIRLNELRKLNKEIPVNSSSDTINTCSKNFADDVIYLDRVSNRSGVCKSCGLTINLSDALENWEQWENNWAIYYYCPYCNTSPNLYISTYDRGPTLLLGIDKKEIIDQIRF